MTVYLKNVLAAPAVLTLVLLTTNPAQAGVVNGGGGKGVVCRSTAGDVTSVESLDLWEGRVLRGQIAFPVVDLSKAVDAAVVALADSFPFRISSIDCKDQSCLVQEMKKNAAQFLDPKSSIVRLRGVDLEDTADSLELIHPKNCAVEQIVNYQPEGGSVLLNQDLFEKMDLTSQAALIAHESFYEVLRYWVSETNSLRTRRTVSYIMSGNRFQWPPAGLSKPGNYLCKADVAEGQSPAAPFNMYVQISSDFKQIFYANVFGSPLIGSKVITADMPGLEVILGTACAAGPTYAVQLGKLDNPVEADRSAYLIRKCEGTTAKFSLSVRAPGSTKPVLTPVDCQQIK